MGMTHPPDPAGEPPDPSLIIDTGYATATGPRPDNQDRVAVSPAWAIVSDGAGGHHGGALAAQLTLDAVIARVGAPGAAPDDRLLDLAVRDADDAVRDRQAGDAALSSMAATLTMAVAAAVDESGSTWRIVDIGDSPAWLVTPQQLTRVSQEDNVAAELVRAGVISREDARHHPGRHVITQAIGATEPATASPTTVTLRPGDGLVLASDGVDVLDETTIMEVVSGAPSAAQAARRLVDAALARGATDNVTVAVVRHRQAPPADVTNAPQPGAGSST